MSSSGGDLPAGKVMEGLQAVEAFWHARLPESFHNLYRQFEAPFLAPCEFFTLETIVSGTGRMYGQLPQFLPFGRAVGEGGHYGFYVSRETAPGRWPVLYWDDDEEYYRPVSSDFDAFLRNCFLVGRYETEDQLPDDSLDDITSEVVRKLSLPAHLAEDPIPGNDTELQERLISFDSQDAVSLCHLGCARRSRGDVERALDFFHRAVEAAPWFGDPCYLLADVHRERGDHARATQGWWSVVQRLIPLCTRTWDWDLGEDHPEADVYEVAADALAQFADSAEPAIKASPLWRVVVHDDPYDPDVREALGDALLSQNDVQGAEREYLNALSLCRLEKGRQPERLYDALLGIYERKGTARDIALTKFDRALRRR